MWRKIILMKNKIIKKIIRDEYKRQNNIITVYTQNHVLSYKWVLN